MIIIGDDDNPVPTTQFAPRLFTVEDDGELILSREKMGDQAQWDAVANDFNRKFSHAPRSTDSLRSRYIKFLQEDISRRPSKVSHRQKALDALRQKGIEHSLDNPSTFSSTSRKFTPEEDGELILLREKCRGMARWDRIRKDYNANFPDAPRSIKSLNSRYAKVLKEFALDQIQGGLNQRERAIAALQKQGIELQVNDPISDSDSDSNSDSDSEEEDDTDESEEEQDEEPEE